MNWLQYANFTSTMLRFDPIECATLHNQLVARSVDAAQEQLGNRVVRNYFEAYGEDAREARSRLSQPLISFLESIDVFLPSENGSSQTMNIAPHVQLAHPLDLWLPVGGLPNFQDRDAHDNWIALYRGTIAEHDVYFDMDTNMCTWHQEVTAWPNTWYPLARMLKVWLSLFEAGKFHPSSGEGIYDRRAVSQMTEYDLTISLHAYDDLLNAICERNSNLSIGEPGLIFEAVLDRYHIFDFTREFLLRARRPNFSFIAPGLQIPTDEKLSQLLQYDINSARYQLIRHEGLVPSDDERTDPKSMQDYIGEPLPLFPGPLITQQSKAFKSYPGPYTLDGLSGLYIWPHQWFGDGAALILPKPNGHNGYITDGNPGWTRDSHLRQSPPDVLINNDALMRHGDCPFLFDHPPRLFTILGKFASLVRSGRWTIGADGVLDDVEKWFEADTAQYAAEYRLGACFDE